MNIGVLGAPTIAEPNDNLLVQGKINWNLSAKRSAFIRYAQELYHNQDFLGANSALLDWAPSQTTITCAFSTPA